MRPPAVDYAPDVPTVPNAPMMPPVAGASDRYAADGGNVVIGGTAGMQRKIGGGAPVAMRTDHIAAPQYTPLSRVAFAPYDASHRTLSNLFHPPAPTDLATPMPDVWNPFTSLRNWPSRAYAGLKISVFPGPRAPTPKGRSV